MSPKTPRFLMVEDESFTSGLYAQKFKKAGLEFAVIPDPDGDFIHKVIGFNPDVILMDIHFEGSQSDGVVAAEALALDVRTKNIPIIFFTNADREDLAERAQKLPSSIGFLVKAAYTPSELVSKVQELYNGYSKHRTE